MSGTSECGEGIEAQWGGKLGKNEREKQHGEVTEESITDAQRWRGWTDKKYRRREE